MLVETRQIGRSTRRIEDERLLQGKGQYVSDITPPGTLHAAFVRSPHAHALICGIDYSQALKVPGVVAVITADEMERYVKSLRMPLEWPTVDLPPDITPYVLTPEEVCFVGEAVAMVLATSRYIAEDGANLVQVEYEPLPVLSDCRQALLPDAPKVRLDCKNNVLRNFRIGYNDCDEVFSKAPHVFKESRYNNNGYMHRTYRSQSLLLSAIGSINR